MYFNLSFSNLPYSMPYVEATTLESLRMFMGRGFAVPHRAVRDTTLGEYFIPKVSAR